MTIEPFEMLSPIRCVFARPSMYTPHGRLSEIVAFLAGCELGFRSERPLSECDQSLADDAQELADLMRWLHDVSGLSRSDPARPNALAHALQKVFEDDDRFVEAVREFLKERAANRTRPAGPGD